MARKYARASPGPPRSAGVPPAPARLVHRPAPASLPGDFHLTPMPKLATFETNRGTIVAELYDDAAPKTVANFEKLANGGYYDGVKFHRVIPEFVVQGGDPYSRDLPAGDRRIGTGGPGYTIPDELKGNPYKHVEGALSMAHAGPNTGGSQFFIVLSEANTRHLNGVHTVFGKVIEGMDVVKQIKGNDTMNRVRVSGAEAA